MASLCCGAGCGCTSLAFSEFSLLLSGFSVAAACGLVVDDGSSALVTAGVPPTLLVGSLLLLLLLLLAAALGSGLEAASSL